MKVIKDISLRGNLLFEAADPVDEYLLAPAINIEEILGGSNINEDVTEYAKYAQLMYFDIIGYDESLSQQFEVGKIFGCFCNFEKAIEDNFDISDLIFGIAFESLDPFYVSLICNHIKSRYYENETRNFFIINEIFIEEEYRSNMVGSASVKLLSQALEYQFNRRVSCFIAEISDENERFSRAMDEEISVDSARYNRFFEKLGFRVKKDEKCEIYQILDVSTNQKKLSISKQAQ